MTKFYLILAHVLVWGLYLSAVAIAGYAETPEQHAQHTLEDPTGGLLLWADQFTARGWVGVATLAILLGFAAFFLKLRQQGSLAKETAAFTAALRAARTEYTDKRKDPPDAA